MGLRSLTHLFRQKRLLKGIQVQDGISHAGI